MLFLFVSAHDCKPCQRMTPIIGRIEASYASEQVNFARIDKRYSPTLTAELGVTIVPTYVFFMKSKMLARIRGSCDEDVLRSHVSKFVYKADSFGW